MKKVHEAVDDQPMDGFNDDAIIMGLVVARMLTTRGSDGVEREGGTRSETLPWID